MQNVLIGRVTNLHLLPNLIQKGTGLTPEQSFDITSVITQTILIPFNAVMQCWDEDVVALFDDLGSAHVTRAEYLKSQTIQ